MFNSYEMELYSAVTCQVYSEEVSRCVEMVFSLLHIDLPACTLALLLHLLPRLLAGMVYTDLPACTLALLLHLLPRLLAGMVYTDLPACTLALPPAPAAHPGRYGVH